MKNTNNILDKNTLAIYMYLITSNDGIIVYQHVGEADVYSAVVLDANGDMLEEGVYDNVEFCNLIERWRYTLYELS